MCIVQRKAVDEEQMKNREALLAPHELEGPMGLAKQV